MCILLVFVSNYTTMHGIEHMKSLRMLPLNLNELHAAINITPNVILYIFRAQLSSTQKFISN